MTIRGVTGRTVHVEHCMGTVFTIDIRDPGEWGPAVNRVVAWLHRADAVFSTYKPDSDISRIQCGELRVEDADPCVSTVLDLCARAHSETRGAFTAMAEGRLDPTGLVKGWAVEQASQLLNAHGAANHAINGGGDMQLAGEPEPGRSWTVGISDPGDRARVITTISGRDFAVATSGIAERGAHIRNSFNARPVTAIASATVAGPSLTFADAYATAAAVLETPAWIDDVAGYAALVVDTDGILHTSAAWQHDFTTSPLPEHERTP